jgi:hypothetical protein
VAHEGELFPDTAVHQDTVGDSIELELLHAPGAASVFDEPFTVELETMRMTRPYRRCFSRDRSRSDLVFMTSSLQSSLGLSRTP